MTQRRKTNRKGGVRVERVATNSRFVTRDKMAQQPRSATVKSITRSSKDAIKKGSRRFAKALESLAKR